MKRHEPTHCKNSVYVTISDKIPGWFSCKLIKADDDVCECVQDAGKCEFEPNMDRIIEDAAKYRMIQRRFDEIRSLLKWV
jgi:hypothetical protein